MRHWKPAWVVGIALSIIFGGAFFFRPPSIDAWSAVFALSIILLGLSPTFIYLQEKVRPPVPFLPAVGWFYALAFGLPIFLADIVWPGEHVSVYYRVTDFEPTHIGFAAAGIACFIVALTLGQTWLRVSSIQFRLPHGISQRRLRVMAWSLLIGHFFYIYVPQLHKLPSIGQFLMPAGLLGFGLFLVLAMKRLSPRYETAIVFLGLVPIKVISSVLGVSLAPVLLVIFLGFLAIPFSRKAALVLLVGGALSIPVFYLPLQILRGAAWPPPPSYTQAFGPGAPALSAVAKAEFLMRSLASDEKSTGISWHTRLAAPFRRIAQIAVFAVVMDMTPSNVSFWQGETYKPLFTSFVPRALWPNKPEERAGNAFGKRYGFLKPDDDVTSINLPWLTEAYANFGFAGMLAGMSLFGFLLAALDRFFNAPSMTAYEIAVGWTVLFPLILPESNFTLLCGSLLPLALCFYLFFRFGSGVRLPRSTGS